MTQRPPDHNVLGEAWDHVVGGLDWLGSVLLGEFADQRPLSAVVADMLVSFLPGVVIVTSARDAVAVVLRLASHPEKREDLMEWVLLCACLIVIALPLAMAAGGAAAAGVGAVVGGIAGSELGAALRAVMLMLIKEAQKLIEVVQSLQKFIHGDVLKFLRAIKFATYEKALIHALHTVSDKLLHIVSALRTHLESLHYFDSVKAAIARLTEWEKRFYAVQQDALKHVPKALVELDARLAKVLAQTAPKEAHTVAAGVQADKTLAGTLETRRIKDTPGKIIAKMEDKDPLTNARLNEPPGQAEKAALSPASESATPPRSEPKAERSNAKKQEALDARAVSQREEAAKIAEQVGRDIKNHPLRTAYEREVVGLREEAEMMAKSGATDEAVARTLWSRRREIGVKYKEMTPRPLRDYIYEINNARYGDPLGPSFDDLVRSAEKKMVDPFKMIIDSSSRPNGDVNALLSRFEDWLTTKDPSYLTASLRNVGG